MEVGIMKRMETIMLDDISELTPLLITTLITKHKLEAIPRFHKLRRYYEGHQDILKRTFADQSKPNNRIVANFCKMVSDITQGYFMGSPINYIGSDERFLLHLQDLYNVNNEKNQNSLLAKDSSIFGVGYELLYMDSEANINFVTLPVEEVIMIYSTTLNKKPIGAIRHYLVRDYLDSAKDYEKVEVYTEDTIYYFTSKSGLLKLDEQVPHYFGICPIIPYMNNDEEIGDFEGIMSLQDAYNSAVSDQANDFEYMADSYLVITGAEDTEAEEFTNMKQNRLILLNETGSATWLAKTTDNATIESYKNRLTKDIHRFSNVPDINSEEFANSDISGTALKYRWQSMEQACSNKERLFAESLMDRQKAICNILAIKGLHFDYASVYPTFKRNIPVNSNEVVQIVSTLNGLVSKETLLAQIPFIDDVQIEMERLEEEQLANDPYNNQALQQPFADKIAEEPEDTENVEDGEESEEEEE